MSGPAFTPGPWSIFPYVQQPGTFTIIDASKQKLRIAKVDDSYDGILRADAHANARLIATAPTNYALLERASAQLRAMVLDLPGLLRDAGLSDEEHMCESAEALADEIDAALAQSRGEQ